MIKFGMKGGDIPVPQIAEFTLEMPPFFATPTKKGWKLLNPMTTVRNLAKRKHELSVDLSRSNVRRPMVTRSEALPSPAFSDFSAKDQEKLREWEASVNAKPEGSKGGTHLYAHGPVKERGRPVYLAKNGEHHGMEFNEDADEYGVNPKAPPKPKKARGRPKGPPKPPPPPKRPRGRPRKPRKARAPVAVEATEDLFGNLQDSDEEPEVHLEEDVAKEVRDKYAQMTRDLIGGKTVKAQRKEIIEYIKATKGVYEDLGLKAERKALTKAYNDAVGSSGGSGLIGRGPKVAKAKAGDSSSSEEEYYSSSSSSESETEKPKETAAQKRARIIEATKRMREKLATPKVPKKEPKIVVEKAVAKPTGKIFTEDELRSMWFSPEDKDLETWREQKAAFEKPNKDRWAAYCKKQDEESEAKLKDKTEKWDKENSQKKGESDEDFYMRRFSGIHNLNPKANPSLGKKGNAQYHRGETEDEAFCRMIEEMTEPPKESYTKLASKKAAAAAAEDPEFLPDVLPPLSDLESISDLDSSSEEESDSDHPSASSSDEEEEDEEPKKVTVLKFKEPKFPEFWNDEDLLVSKEKNKDGFLTVFNRDKSVFGHWDPVKHYFVSLNQSNTPAETKRLKDKNKKWNTMRLDKRNHPQGMGFKGPDWEHLNWGSFTEQFKAFKRQHPNVDVDTLEDFADKILEDPEHYRDNTIKRARFYNNVILKKKSPHTYIMPHSIGHGIDPRLMSPMPQHFRHPNAMANIYHSPVMPDFIRPIHGHGIYGMGMGPIGQHGVKPVGPFMGHGFNPNTPAVQRNTGPEDTLRGFGLGGRMPTGDWASQHVRPIGPEGRPMGMGIHSVKPRGGGLKKGSQEAKDFMASIRKKKMRGGAIPSPHSRSYVTDPTLL